MHYPKVMDNGIDIPFYNVCNVCGKSIQNTDKRVIMGRLHAHWSCCEIR